jgi:hypothetical protein
MVLNYTWDEVEAELVLRNLQQPIDERQKLRDYYLRLREECRVATETAKSLLQFDRE